MPPIYLYVLGYVPSFYHSFSDDSNAEEWLKELAVAVGKQHRMERKRKVAVRVAGEGKEYNNWTE